MTDHMPRQCLVEDSEYTGNQSTVDSESVMDSRSHEIKMNQNMSSIFLMTATWKADFGCKQQLLISCKSTSWVVRFIKKPLHSRRLLAI